MTWYCQRCGLAVHWTAIVAPALCPRCDGGEFGATLPALEYNAAPSEPRAAGEGQQ